MSSEAMLLIACSLLSIAAFGYLCLAMKRNRKQLKSHRKLPLPIVLRWCGWLLTVSICCIAIYAEGWGIGIVSLLAVMSLAAVVVILLLTYRPQWIILTMTTGLVLGVVSAGFAFAG